MIGMDTNTVDSEYIDFDDGLARVGGNVALYKRLLGHFVDENLYDALEDFLMTGKMEDATRQAHSIKGVSSNLSLVKLHSISIELERSLKDNDDYSSHLIEFKEAFSITTEKIRKLLDEV